MADIDWFGDEEMARIRKLAGRKLDKAALVVTRRAKQKLSVPGRVVVGKPGRDKAGKFTKARRAVVHAPAGEPPYKQTGRLRASITWERDGELSRRVGSNLEYARNQELGITVHPHPYLRPALSESRDEIDRIFSEGDRP